MNISKKVNDFLSKINGFSINFQLKSKEVSAEITEFISSHPAATTFFKSVLPAFFPQQSLPIIIGYMFLQFLSFNGKKSNLSLGELEKEFKEFEKYIKEIQKELGDVDKYVKECGIDLLEKILVSVNQQNKDKDIDDFFKGLKPTWNIIINSIDIKRKEEDKIISKLRDGKNVLLLGNSGSGKSVLLMRIAYDLRNEYVVFYSTGQVVSEKSIDFIKEFTSEDKSALVIIDNILPYKDRIIDLANRVRSQSLNVNFVLGEQRERFKGKEDFITLNFEEVNLILDEETEREFIMKFSEIKSRVYSEEDINEIVKRAKGVFPVLVLLVSGDSKTLEKSINDIYSIISDIEKPIIKIILFTARYNVEMPKKLLREIFENKMDVSEILNSLREKGLVKIEENDLISSLHLEIAKKILKEKFGVDDIEKNEIVNRLINVKEEGEYYQLFFYIGFRMQYSEDKLSEKMLRKALKINPNDVDARTELGRTLYNLGNNNEAEKEFREAIRINTNIARAHYWFGSLLENLQRYNEAEKEFRDALMVDPNNVYAHQSLGELLLHLQRYNEAEKEFRDALMVDPNYILLHFDLSKLFEKTNLLESIEKIYREAVKIHPNSFRLHFYLGKLLEDSKLYEEAEKEYREAIRIDPNNTYAHSELGALFEKSKRYEEAEKEYREVIRIKPDDALAHYNLGLLLFRANRLEEAEKEYREVIRIKPDYASAFYNLSCLHSILNDKANAVEYLRKAIIIDNKYKELAKNDSDFGNLREEENFKNLLK